MEIIVQGRASEYFTPNEVILNINFVTKGDSYEEVLRNGIENVQVFVESLLLKNGFMKEDMKTSSFVVKEDTKYNKVTGEYESDGYSYNQSAILRFDYDKELLANMMISISKLDNAPSYRVNFGVKDEKECRKNLLTLAYKDALEQAQTIALAAGKTLKCCQKVDFKPFRGDCISISGIDSQSMFNEDVRFLKTEAIVNTFTPEDIELSEVLYCLWITE